MENFVQFNKQTFKYQTPVDENGQQVEVRIAYQKDFSRRGIYVSGNIQTIKDGRVSFLLTDTLSAFVLSAMLFNAAELKSIVEVLDPLAPRIAELIQTKDPLALLVLVTRQWKRSK